MSVFVGAIALFGHVFAPPAAALLLFHVVACIKRGSVIDTRISVYANGTMPGMI